MAQVTEMYRVINSVLETKTLGLRMVPIFNDGVWNTANEINPKLAVFTLNKKIKGDYTLNKK